MPWPAPCHPCIAGRGHSQHFRSTIPIWHSAGSMNGAWFARCCLGHVLRGEVMPNRPTDRRPAS